MSTPIEAALARAAHWAAQADAATTYVERAFAQGWDDWQRFAIRAQALAATSSAHSHLATALRDQLDADTADQLRAAAYRDALPGDPEATTEDVRRALDAWQRAVMFTARDLNEQIAEVDEVVAASDTPLPENKAWTDALRWALKVLAKHTPKAVSE